MIPLSRPLLIGELWWSALARHMDVLGRTSLVPRHVGLAGNRRSLGSPLFPRQLDTLLVALEVKASPERIIEGHSMLPLVRPFFSARKTQHAIAAMRGSGNAEMALGLAPMKDYPLTLRLCRVCWERDRALFGTAMWHRSHQAPGTIVCHEHHCELSTTAVSCRAKQFVALTSADSIRADLSPITLPSSHKPDAVRLAENMHALLSQTVSAVDQGQLAQLYRGKLRAKGFIDDFERLRLTHFTEAFIDRFGPLLNSIGYARPDILQRDHWLARLVREPRSEASPLGHVLLMQFLEIEVTAAFTEAAQLQRYTGRHCAPTLPMRRSKRVTEEKVMDKREEWQAHLKSALPGSVRAQNDTLYCWLWRNDRAWLASTLT